MSSIPQRLDKYEMVERLGAGGAAEVWKAFDTQLRRNVAMKVLHSDLREDPNFIARFQREAQMVASLNHPNIVQIHDFQVLQTETADCPAPSVAYMVMDYVEGQTLADYIHRTSYKGNIPQPFDLVNLFTSISLAIDYAHSKGVIHRDIKPANILLDQQNTACNPAGEPILTDFGVAKILGSASNTQSGLQLGTPFYMAPEQASGYPGNERCDLYALGIILYEMLTGALPFRGKTLIDIMTQHIIAKPTSPLLFNPLIPPAIAQVVMRSLAKEPDARFASASALTIALAEAYELPIPEALGQSDNSLDRRDMPTMDVVSSVPPDETTYVLTQTASTQKAPRVPLHVDDAQEAARNTPSQRTYPVLPIVPSGYKRLDKKFYLTLVGLFLVVLIIDASLYVPALFIVPGPVGHAFYVNSGYVNVGTAQGIADQIQLNLHSISEPQAGNSYYVWLLGDKGIFDQSGSAPVQPPLLLTNSLMVQNGNVKYFFSGDSHHNNLLATTSRLLITEGPANRSPKFPSRDRQTWRYFAALPQAVIPYDSLHSNALAHMRYLFYNEKNLNALGLPGGLEIWLFRNTEKVLELSVSARDNWNGQTTDVSQLRLMQDQFIRILDYLDGIANVHVDLPVDTPILADPVIARVALLTVDSQHQGNSTNPSGYVNHVQSHVSEIAKAPDITPEMHLQAKHIIEELNNTQTWLLNVRKDAVQLFNLGSDPAQMKQASVSVLLDDMVTQAMYAYIGRLDPATNVVCNGVAQAYYDMQRLATFTITANIPKSI